MSLVRWSPFNDVETLFNRMLPTGFVNWPRMALMGNGGKNIEWTPSADISETAKEYVIRAELPAVQKEDVSVTYEDGVITIKGERKQKREDKNEKFHRVESFYGSFERSFSLPENAKSDAISCESKDGVLTVRIPKSESAKGQVKQIAVQ